MSSSQSQNSLFRQQQHLYRSAHFLTKPKSKSPILYTPPSNDGVAKGRKRRASYEDEEMTNSDSIEYRTSPILSLKEDSALHATKRIRMHAKKEFPISKLLATLDEDKLIELINDLVESNPHLKSEVDAFIPPTTTTQSISSIPLFRQN
ncbi:MAG: hypothetical protein EXX96DRAFT_190012 [Benjaminiella poitrasii]|nr:MAG: hypothetical protein EXX96DRAFT_190012 [Benjaminiella poitrasii]